MKCKVTNTRILFKCRKDERICKYPETIENYFNIKEILFWSKVNWKRTKLACCLWNFAWWPGMMPRWLYRCDITHHWSNPLKPGDSSLSLVDSICNALPRVMGHVEGNSVPPTEKTLAHPNKKVNGDLIAWWKMEIITLYFFLGITVGLNVLINAKHSII